MTEITRLLSTIEDSSSYPRPAASDGLESTTSLAKTTYTIRPFQVYTSPTLSISSPGLVGGYNHNLCITLANRRVQH